MLGKCSVTELHNEPHPRVKTKLTEQRNSCRKAGLEFWDFLKGDDPKVKPWLEALPQLLPWARAKTLVCTGITTELHSQKHTSLSLWALHSCSRITQPKSFTSLHLLETLQCVASTISKSLPEKEDYNLMLPKLLHTKYLAERMTLGSRWQGQQQQSTKARTVGTGREGSFRQLLEGWVWGFLKGGINRTVGRGRWD
jgi:hypothetical protein